VAFLALLVLVKCCSLQKVVIFLTWKFEELFFVEEREIFKKNFMFVIKNWQQHYYL